MAPTRPAMPPGYPYIRCLSVSSRYSIVGHSEFGRRLKSELRQCLSPNLFRSLSCLSPSYLSVLFKFPTPLLFNVGDQSKCSTFISTVLKFSCSNIFFFVFADEVSIADILNSLLFKGWCPALLYLRSI